MNNQTMNNPLFMIATLLAVIVYNTKHSIASKCEKLIRIS